MPKRGFGSPDGGRTANDQKQHLYLVLENPFWGFGFHPLDMPPDGHSEDDASDLPSGCDCQDHAAEPSHTLPSKRSEWQLPPALYHMECHQRLPGYATAAFRTKIITMPPKILDGISRPYMEGGIISLIDVHTREITFAPEPPKPVALPIYFPLADKLFVLSRDHFQVLFHPLPPAHNYAWVELPDPPFERHHVASYGVYPDETAIFVSVICNSDYVRATYIFKTALKDPQWELLGNWLLPFVGRAHFNSELDLWVGLSSVDSGGISVCVADLNNKGVSKKVLYCNDQDECHVGATLIFMASRNKFCLVQSISVGHDSQGRELPKLCFLFRLTMFSLSVYTDGELQIGNDLKVRYYKVPDPSYHFSLTSPSAFWM